MGDEKPDRRSRRNNTVYGSLWVQSGADPQPSWSVPLWMIIAPALILLVAAVGFFGLVFLGWEAPLPQVGP
jgi:hypothetical protein